MSLRIIATLLVATLVVGCSHSSEGSRSTDSQARSTSLNEFERLREVILEGRFTVDVMELALPTRANELMARFIEAGRQNPEWMMEHVKKTEAGKPLAYDPRFGISEAEYDELSELLKQRSVAKAREATITIRKNAENVFVFDGGESLPEFAGLEVDLERRLVRTPYGILKDFTARDSTEEVGMGAYRGVSWELEHPNSDGGGGTFLRLSVGKLKRSGRGVLYYKVTSGTVKGLTFEGTKFQIVLHFDLVPQS